MHIIALTGLVSVEKIDLTIDLAAYYREHGQRVAIVDNVARMAIDPARLDGVPVVRLDGDLSQYLGATLEHLDAGIVILAASEVTNPHDLYATLDLLSNVSVTALALIDTRTCDCFPQVRDLLVSYADVVVNVPYNTEHVIDRLNA